MSRRPTSSESEDVGEHGFDGLLSGIGFGKWQAIILMSPILAMALYPVHLLGASFLNAPMPFRCTTGLTELLCDRDGIGCRNGSDTLDTSVNASSSYNFDSRCLPPSSSLFNETILRLIDGVDLRENQKRTHLTSCPIVEYDTSVFTSTAVSEFDLVCERNYLRPWFVTLGTIGNMCGSIFGGYVGDRWGRIRAVQVGVIFNILMTLSLAFAPSYSLVLVARLFVGCFSSATMVPAWSSGLECTPAKHRTLTGMLLGLPFSVFLMGYAGMAYFIRTWQYLLMAAASPALVLLVTSFISSESPRWLVQKGRLEDARKVLLLSTKLNGTNMEAVINAYVDKLALKQKQDSRASPSEDQTSCRMSMVASLKKMVSYLLSPVMRTIIICIGIVWILHNLLYVGVALNANNFSNEDPFLYVALTGAMDAAAILLTTPLTPYIGRRILIMVSFLVSGLFFFLELAVPENLDWLRWVLVMSGFFLVAGSIQVNYLYAPEVFPTEIRARGFAFVQVLGNLGSSIAPFITDVLSVYTWWGPSVAFGCSGIIGGLMLPFLPETRNKPLPDTVKEVEERRTQGLRRNRFPGQENKAYVGEDASIHL